MDIEEVVIVEGEAKVEVEVAVQVDGEFQVDHPRGPHEF